MTYHADTIRRARASAQWWLDDEGDLGTISGRSMQMARDSLAVVELAESLLAERQQAIDERDRARREWEASSEDWIKEAQRAVDAELKLEQAIDEVEKLRDRAVCSGCGQDVDKCGACSTECCVEGEMIPSSELPFALLRSCEQRCEERSEFVAERQQAIDEREIHRRAADIAEARCEQAIDALREIIEKHDAYNWHEDLIADIARAALLSLEEQP